jgi:hypothetical protein
VTLVVDTSLDAVTEVNTEFGLLVLQLSVERGVFLEYVSQEVVVVLKVGESCGHVLSEEGGSLLGAVVFKVSTSELDPLGEGLDIGGKSSRRVISGSGGGASTLDTGLCSLKFSLNIFLLLEHAFPSDKVGNTLDENVNESGLTVSKTISVRNIPSTSSGCGINTSGSTHLELELTTEFLKVLSSREKGELDHASSSESCSKVGRAGKDVTKMVIMHEIFAHGLESLSDDVSGFSKTVENGVYIITLFHGNNSGMVFLINPDKEVSSFIVEDTSSVGPVTATSGREKEGGVRLLEEITSVSESFFFGVRHTVRLGSVRSRASEGEVVSLKIAFEL